MTEEHDFKTAKQNSKEVA